MKVADGVEQFTDQELVNWFLIETDEGPVAVDAGLPTAWRQIRDRAKDLRAIVLTHGHIDHLGFAPAAQRGRGTQAVGFFGKTVKDPTPYDEGSELPGGLRAIFTPGHTKGHMALHLPDRDIVFAGDALVTWDIYTDRRGPRLIARAATWNSTLNLESLDRIAETGAGTLVSGHGEPWRDGAASAASAAREAGAA